MCSRGLDRHQAAEAPVAVAVTRLALTLRDELLDAVDRLTLGRCQTPPPYSSNASNPLSIKAAGAAWKAAACNSPLTVY